MELNTEKIINELSRINQKQPWLADKLNLTRQGFYQMMERRSLKYVDNISKILLIDKRDLVKF